jgi:hypothetical protein
MKRATTKITKGKNLRRQGYAGQEKGEATRWSRKRFALHVCWRITLGDMLAAMAGR